MFYTNINPIYIEVAKQIMENIQNNCGPESCLDGGFKYPKYWVDLIAKYSQPLFDNHPEILTDDFLNDISCRKGVIRTEISFKYPEFNSLNDILDKYSDSL